MVACGANEVRARLAKALLIVVAVFCAIPCIEWLAAPFAKSDASVLQVENGFALEAFADPFDTLSQVEGVLQRCENRWDGSFVEEIGILPSARDFKINGDGSVGGYLVDGRARDVAGALDELMGKKGWSGVGLGAIEGSTYLKEEGVFRWALVTCTQVGESTTVVVRVMPS